MNQRLIQAIFVNTRKVDKEIIILFMVDILNRMNFQILHCDYEKSAVVGQIV